MKVNMVKRAKPNYEFRESLLKEVTPELRVRR
jgi:hypothetical protein